MDRVTDDDFQKVNYEGGVANNEKQDDSCCCGCSLRCAIITFGVLSIIQFFVILIIFILMCAAVGVAKVASQESMKNWGGEFQSGQAKQLQNAVGAASSGAIAIVVLVGIFIVVPALLPGILYIRYFCQESEDRLQKLRWAHIIFVAVSTLGLVYDLSQQRWGGAVMSSINVGLNYYFYTVVQRYIANKSTS